MLKFAVHSISLRPVVGVAVSVTKERIPHQENYTHFHVHFGGF
jgi:hypothetical protein